MRHHGGILRGILKGEDHKVAGIGGSKRVNMEGRIKHSIILMLAMMLWVGMVFASQTVHAETVINTDWTLTEDETVIGNLSFTDGTIDLNGYTFLNIQGDLIQGNGHINVTNGISLCWDMPPSPTPMAV